jgi:hypothetical protein
MHLCRARRQSSLRFNSAKKIKSLRAATDGGADRIPPPDQMRSRSEPPELISK